MVACPSPDLETHHFFPSFSVTGMPGLTPWRWTSASATMASSPTS